MQAQAYNPKNMVPTVKHGGAVQCCALGPGNLVWVEGDMKIED